MRTDHLTKEDVLPGMRQISSINLEKTRWWLLGSWREGASFFWCESRKIAVTVTASAGFPIALLLREFQLGCLCHRQFGVITRFRTLFASRDITLALCFLYSPHFPGAQFGLVASAPRFDTVRKIPCVISSGYLLRFKICKRGMIASPYTVRAIGNIAFALRSGHFNGFLHVEHCMITRRRDFDTPGNVLPALRDRNCTGLLWTQNRVITRPKSIQAGGNITLVLSYRQRDGFGGGEFRRITGRITAPAI
ncbi:MAG TPA: hypothetical protein VN577_11535 [Terriglobales bacterium]|nr:hypothetical protein [Terriglobales bacterium]